jgi:hypothetical protein
MRSKAATTVPRKRKIVNRVALYPQITGSDKGNFVIAKKGQLVTRIAHHERSRMFDHARPIGAGME